MDYKIKHNDILKIAELFEHKIRNYVALTADDVADVADASFRHTYQTTFYWDIKRFGLDFDTNEFLPAIYEGIKAAFDYHNPKGKSSITTFVWMCVESNLKRYWERKIRKVEKHFQIFDCNSDLDVDEINVEKFREPKLLHPVDRKYFLNKLKKAISRDKNKNLTVVLYLLMKGYEPQEIADIMHTYRQKVNFWQNRIIQIGRSIIKNGRW